ncbi:MAG TPA: glutathione S-transferase family protein [Usitatibacter sp.]|nr:glutathione S-transferase family protein [Usitatibacter sp.]
MAFEFYHGHGSPYSWRVWLALEHKKIPYELRVLSFANKDTQKPEFVAINPRHVVPTVVDDGFALWESVVILEYLDERFPATPKLYPGDARERARIRRLIREAEEHVDRKGIDPITDELFWKEGSAPDMAKVEEWKRNVAGELAILAGELRGDYLAGDGLTAADFVLYPMVAYAKRITFRKPETKLTDAIPDELAAWAKRIEALPYFDKTFPPHWR